MRVDRGGLGLRSIETTYKTTKIKAAHYINANTDPRIQQVRVFQDNKQSKNLRSLINDAKRFGNEFDVQLMFNYEEKSTHVTWRNEVLEIKNKQPRNINPTLVKATQDHYERTVRNQPWLGDFTTKHWDDPDMSPNKYLIDKQWKNIPDMVLSVNYSIKQQLLSTKVYQKLKIQQSIKDTTCRFCHNTQETIIHLFSSCGGLAQTLYKSRHDKMLRPYYHYLLHIFGFQQSDHQKPWYQQAQPTSVVENERAKILWDIPIHITRCPPNGANKPDMLIINKQDEELILIEGTVCAINYVKNKTEDKQTKYSYLRQGLSSLYRDWSINQINIVFDFMAGYHRSLEQNLQLLGNNRIMTDLIRKSQKWVLAQNVEIAKRLY